MMVIAWIAIPMSDLSSLSNRPAEESHRYQAVRLEIFVPTLNSELEAGIARPMPAEGKDLAWVCFCTRRATSDMAVLADLVISGGVTDTPLDGRQVCAFRCGNKSHTFLQAKKSPALGEAAKDYLFATRKRRLHQP